MCPVFVPSHATAEPEVSGESIERKLIGRAVLLKVRWEKLFCAPTIKKTQHFYT